MGSVWVRCPLSAARKLAQLNRIVIGWSASRVEILPSRPMQCFKCLRTGHVKAQCRAMVDRSGRCFRCGERGHAAKGCQAPVKCPICSDLGAPAGHRMGSINCNPPGEKTLLGRGDVKVKTKMEEIKIEGENARGRTGPSSSALPTEETLNKIMASARQIGLDKNEGMDVEVVE